MLHIISRLRNSVQYSLGVDFGTTALKAVVLADTPKQPPKIVGAYLVPYTILGEGNISEDAKLKCLKVLREGPLSTLISNLKTVVYCIPAAEVIIRSFSWQGNDAKGFIPAVKAQIEDWVPGMNQDLVVDFEAYIPDAVRIRRNGHLDVLVAITRAHNVDKIRELGLSNDLTPPIIDTEWSALINVLSYFADKGRPNSRILLDLGSSSCKMIVLRGTSPPTFFNIDLQLNGLEASNLSDNYYAQRRILNFICPDDIRLAHTDSLDNQTLEAINGEMITKIKYAVSEIRLDDSCEVYITGGYSEYSLILEGISELFKRQVVRLGPLRWLDMIKRTEAGTQGINESWGAERFSVAAGLAIRGLSEVS